jgi:hypothetical protein
MENKKDFIKNNGENNFFLFEGMHHELYIDFTENDLRLYPTGMIQYVNNNNLQNRSTFGGVIYNGEKFQQLYFELNEDKRSVTIFSNDKKAEIHFQYVSFFRYEKKYAQT